MFSVTGAAHSEMDLKPPELSPVRWLRGTNTDDNTQNI